MSNQLEIPHSYSPAPYNVCPDQAGYYVTCGLPYKEGTMVLLSIAPAMADEIKRLREELSRRDGEYNALTKVWMKKLDAEREKVKTHTREDRAFQCLQGLLANPSYSETPTKGILQIAIESADAMLAALAKPQTEPSPEKKPEQFNLDRFQQGEPAITAWGCVFMYCGLNSENQPFCVGTYLQSYPRRVE